jgi:hypothetical protein
MPQRALTAVGACSAGVWDLPVLLTAVTCFHMLLLPAVVGISSMIIAHL